MALKIVGASEPMLVESIVVCILGAPGVGKSSMAFAGNGLMLDFDHGAYRAKNRNDCVSVDDWREVENISPKDVEKYDYISLDTAGRALDLLTMDIIASDAKAGRGGTLSIQGYGVLKTRFTNWLKTVKALKKDVVTIAHAAEEKRGDETVIRLDVQGGSKGEIYKTADVMGQLSIQDGRLVLNFSPTDVAYGKNPTGLPPIEVPDYAIDPNFFGNLLKQIKADLNKQTEAQREAQRFQEEWVSSVRLAKTADDLNTLKDHSNTVECDDATRKVCKRVLMDYAIEIGFPLDPKTKMFAAPTEKPEPKQEDKADPPAPTNTTEDAIAQAVKARKAKSKKSEEAL